jgi:hypothetical protein
MAAEHQVMRATSLVAACAPTQPALIGPAPPTFLVIRHPPSAPAPRASCTTSLRLLSVDSPGERLLLPVYPRAPT